MSKPEANTQYDYEELLQMSKDAISKYMLTVTEDIIAFLPCCKKTFYNYKLHEIHELKDLVNANKIKMKQGLKKKWYDEGSAAERIALYKLLGTQDERDALNGRVEEKEVKEVKVIVERKPIQSRDDITND